MMFDGIIFRGTYCMDRYVCMNVKLRKAQYTSLGIKSVVTGTYGITDVRDNVRWM